MTYEANLSTASAETEEQDGFPEADVHTVGQKNYCAQTGEGPQSHQCVAEENSMRQTPNIVYLLADQVRACSLPVYGEKQIETPHIDRLAEQGTVFSNAIATVPVCTPYRSMLLTGRHPQTTGHLINFVKTRHDEIGIGDVFRGNGYRTAWIGKWHLHTGSFPEIGGGDYVPEGRDRLGFEHWRGYNFHTDYFNGTVNLDGWRNERWKGYETDALNRYAFEFMDGVGEDTPFCLFLSPHQAHFTPYEFAPRAYYDRLPAELHLPANVPDALREVSVQLYRHYLAMILAVDDMLGELMAYLERTGRVENTLLVFGADHGTQGGAQGHHFWAKKQPYEESIKVPLIMRLPGVFEGGRTCETLTSPVDLFPSLCGLCCIQPPRTVEGFDLSASWRGETGAVAQEAVLTMNFGAAYDYLVDGDEWRGVRTKTHSYARWLDGKRVLYDIAADPLQLTNLIECPEAQPLAAELEATLARLMAARNDTLQPATQYTDWFDAQRRVVRNACGALGEPEAEPDLRFSSL